MKKEYLIVSGIGVLLLAGFLLMQPQSGGGGGEECSGPQFIGRVGDQPELTLDEKIDFWEQNSCPALVELAGRNMDEFSQCNIFSWEFDTYWDSYIIQCECCNLNI